MLLGTPIQWCGRDKEMMFTYTDIVLGSKMGQRHNWSGLFLTLSKCFSLVYLYHLWYKVISLQAYIVH